MVSFLVLAAGTSLLYYIIYLLSTLIFGLILILKSKISSSLFSFLINYLLSFFSLYFNCETDYLSGISYCSIFFLYSLASFIILIEIGFFLKKVPPAPVKFS
jgi:hypothetical protein